MGNMYNIINNKSTLNFNSKTPGNTYGQLFGETRTCKPCCTFSHVLWALKFIVHEIAHYTQRNVISIYYIKLNNKNYKVKVKMSI